MSQKKRTSEPQPIAIKIDVPVTEIQNFHYHGQENRNWANIYAPFPADNFVGGLEEARYLELDNNVMEAEALELIGSNNRIVGNKATGFEASFQALKIYDSLSLLNKQISLLLQLGTQYTADENYE